MLHDIMLINTNVCICIVLMNTNVMQDIVEHYEQKKGGTILANTNRFTTIRTC